MAAYDDIEVNMLAKIGKPPTDLLSHGGGCLVRGQTVVVSGLTARPELNGRVGRTGRYNHAQQRWHVMLDGDDGPGINVKPVNLRAAG